MLSQFRVCLSQLCRLEFVPFFDSVLSSKKGCSISLYKEGKQEEFGYDAEFFFPSFVLFLLLSFPFHTL